MTQDSFAEALKTEISAGTEYLSVWLDFLQQSGRLERLFEVEAWLRGLWSFFDLHHLPLSEQEKTELVDRSFGPEIRIARTALQVCQTGLADICSAGQPQKLEFEAFSGQTRALSGSDHHLKRLQEQPTPIDSVTRLIESLNDLEVFAEAVATGSRQDCQLFVSMGRIYRKELRACRYVDMLLAQRIRPQYDRVDNAVLSGILRSIADDSLRRDVALALLYILRLLKYLRLAGTELAADRPVRHLLVIFALLHEETASVSEFLRARLLKRQDVPHNLRSALELVLHSLAGEAQRALQHELVFVARESDAPPIYTHIENAHSLLQNCYQSCIVTLVQVFERTLDARQLFPSMLERQQKGLKVRQDLWDLREYMRQTLETRGKLDLRRIAGRLALFRESSLRDLMYHDWAEFEHLSDELVASAHQVEIRSILRKLVAFIEALVQEVSKRSALEEPGAEAVPEISE